MCFTLYILKSEVKDRYYVGHTKNLDRRIKEHNSGQTKSTKPYKPWKIMFIKEYHSKGNAAKAEAYIKIKKSKIFIEKLINGDVELDL